MNDRGNMHMNTLVNSCVQCRIVNLKFKHLLILLDKKKMTITNRESSEKSIKLNTDSSQSVLHLTNSTNRLIKPLVEMIIRVSGILRTNVNIYYKEV